MIRAYATGGARSNTFRGVERSKNKVASQNASSSRTWRERFAFNGSQISNDGKYQINPVHTPYGDNYELTTFDKRGRSVRVGIYGSLESAKSHAK